MNEQSVISIPEGMTAVKTPVPAGARNLRTYYLEVQPGSSEAVAASWAEAAEESGAIFLAVDCRRYIPISFQPFAELLAYLVPLVWAEAPALLRGPQPELQFLLPNLTRVYPELTGETGRPLGEITIGPSKRRLHRESELVFRVAHATTAFIRRAVDTCPSLRGGLVLYFHYLSQADSNTVKALYHLSRRLTGSKVTLVASVTELPGKGSVQADVLSDTYAADQLLAQVIQRTSRVAGTAQSTLPPRPTSVPIPGAVESRLEQTRQLLHGMPGTVLPAGSQFPMADPDRLPSRPGRSESTEATTAILAMNHLQSGENAEALTVGLEALEHMFEHVNHHGTFRLVRALLPIASPDQAIELWNLAGQANAFLKQFRQAVTCFEHALQLATTPVMQAQLNFYLGLLWIKRLKEVERGRAHLKAGFALLEGLESPEAMVEKAWLSNVSALDAFSGRRFQDALNFCQPALRFISPHSGSEAVHLKINLLSNITVVLETAGKYREAVERWQKFRKHLAQASDPFAKHYWYREGGLQLRDGAVDEALDCFTESYRHAGLVEDDFHMEIAARAVGYICWVQGRVTEALDWYGRGLQHLVRLGDPADVAAGHVRMAVLLQRLDRNGEAMAALQAALGQVAEAAAADCCFDSERIRETALRLQQATGMQEWDEAIGVFLERPDTKLNRPFYGVEPVPVSPGKREE